MQLESGLVSEGAVEAAALRYLGARGAGYRIKA
jgi:hypothetical protein